MPFCRASSPQLDAKDPEVTEYAQLPDTDALSERLRGCLQEGEDLPKDYTALFDVGLFGLSPGLVPEARARELK